MSLHALIIHNQHLIKIVRIIFYVNENIWPLPYFQNFHRIFFEIRCISAKNIYRYSLSILHWHNCAQVSPSALCFGCLHHYTPVRLCSGCLHHYTPVRLCSGCLHHYTPVRLCSGCLQQHTRGIRRSLQALPGIWAHGCVDFLPVSPSMTV